MSSHEDSEHSPKETKRLSRVLSLPTKVVFQRQEKENRAHSFHNSSFTESTIDCHAPVRHEKLNPSEAALQHLVNSLDSESRTQLLNAWSRKLDAFAVKEQDDEQLDEVFEYWLQIVQASQGRDSNSLQWGNDSRALLLRSRLLEALLRSYLERPADTPEEEGSLQAFFKTVLKHSVAPHVPDILDSIERLSAATTSHTPGILTKEEVHELACEAVAPLKVDAELEQLDMQIKVLQADLTAHLAASNQPYVNCGIGVAFHTLSNNDKQASSGPARSEWERSQKTWQLSYELRCLTIQRLALIKHHSGRPTEHYDQLMGVVEVPLETLQEQIQSLIEPLGVARQAVGQAREGMKGKLTELGADIKVCDQSIVELEQKRAKLAEELAKVEADLAQWHWKRWELESGRTNYEEIQSNVISQLAKQEQVMAETQAKAMLDYAVLRNCHHLIQVASNVSVESYENYVIEVEAEHAKALLQELQSAVQYCDVLKVNLAHQLQEMAKALKHMDMDVAQQLNKNWAATYSGLEQQRDDAWSKFIESEKISRTLVDQYINFQSAAETLLLELPSLPSKILTPEQRQQLGVQKETLELLLNHLADMQVQQASFAEHAAAHQTVVVASKLEDLDCDDLDDLGEAPDGLDVDEDGEYYTDGNSMNGTWSSRDKTGKRKSNVKMQLQSPRLIVDTVRI